MFRRLGWPGLRVCTVGAIAVLMSCGGRAIEGTGAGGATGVGTGGSGGVGAPAPGQFVTAFKQNKVSKIDLLFMLAAPASLAPVWLRDRSMKSA
jgi:hypothetical protein